MICLVLVATLQTILFTTDDEVLALVAAHDSSFPGHPSHGVSVPVDEESYERPSTADTTTSTDEVRVCVCVCVCVLQMSHDFHVTDFHNL